MRNSLLRGSGPREQRQFELKQKAYYNCRFARVNPICRHRQAFRGQSADHANRRASCSNGPSSRQTPMIMMPLCRAESRSRRSNWTSMSLNYRMPERCRDYRDDNRNCVLSGVQRQGACFLLYIFRLDGLDRNIAGLRSYAIIRTRVG